MNHAGESADGSALANANRSRIIQPVKTPNFVLLLPDPPLIIPLYEFTEDSESGNIG